MSVESNLAISLLKLTKEGPVLTELVKADAHLPKSLMEKLLEKMQSQGLIYLRQGFVDVETEGRLKLAVQAVSSGADLEAVSNLLRWQEFEKIAAYALQNNGYTVYSNIRFKHGGRRWEIDVVGCKKPFVICIDCKHWQHAIAPSALRKIVDSQVDRVDALAAALPNTTLNLECTRWSEARFMPAILSLMPSAFKFYIKVPVVPILQLQDFLNQVLCYTEDLRLIKKNFNLFKP